ncbi:helix-turn-helix domain-containing protein [Endozoicomonas lisbonensis]|uniref:Transposase n=1 Tax=Endozoicomonas lisbonensis TaxID=3120522 RepID=A0ABV2SBD0_9GAMM
MSRKRKQYSSNFKAKVALAAIKGDQTTSELAAHFQIHPTMVSAWKRELLERAAELFGSKADKNSKSHQDEVDNLYRQIGQLSVERDFLARKLDH